MSRGRFLVLAGGALTLAAILQFVDLGAKSMWTDEVYTARIAVEEDFRSFAERFQRSERQPPLHYLLLYGWQKVAGSSDTALRIPSAVLAVGAIPLMAALGSLMFGRREGVLGAYFLAASPIVVLYGRMARYYSTALFFSLASSLLLVMALKRRRSWPLWTAYGVATVAMLLSGYTNGAVLVAQTAFVFLFARGPKFPGRRAFFPALIGVAAAFGIWTVIQWGQISGFGAPPRTYELVGAKAVVLDFIYPYYSFLLGETIFPWHPAALAVLGAGSAFFVMGFARLLREGNWARLPPLVLGIVIVASVIAFQLFIRNIPFSTLPSRAIAALPFFLLILVAGLSKLRSPFLWAWIGVLMLGWGAGILNYFQGRQFHNPTFTVPSREILTSISRRACPTDLIVADQPLGFDYYYPRLGGEASLVVAQQQGEARSIIHESSPRRIWYVELARSGSRAEVAVDLKKNIEAQFTKSGEERFVPLDPIYVRIQEAILGYEAEPNEVTLTIFDSAGASERDSLCRSQ